MVQRIEFRNNGVIDSLTSSMAPAIFHENLSREHAAQQRNFSGLSVITFKIETFEKDNQSSTPNALAISDIWEIETFLIRMSFEIGGQIRDSEFFSRVSEFGFWISLRGGFESAKIASARMLAKIEVARFEFRAVQSFNISVTITELLPEEGLSAFISRVDRNYFPCLPDF